MVTARSLCSSRQALACFSPPQESGVKTQAITSRRDYRSSTARPRGRPTGGLRTQESQIIPFTLYLLRATRVAYPRFQETVT